MSDAAKILGWVTLGLAAWVLVFASLWCGEARAQTSACKPQTWGWTAATGPVTGYEVEVSRNGGAYAKLGDTTGTSIAISGAIGEAVKVRVRAYADDAVPRRTGAYSAESVAYTYCAPLGVPGAPSITAGPTSAIVTEPTVDLAGVPLGPGNPLWACAAWRPGQPGAWLAPTGPAGGGAHPVPWPALTADLPAEYRARCIYPAGWGPEAVAVAAVAVR